MDYTVLWMPAAISELADLWNRSADRTTIANTVDDIDRFLKIDPLNHGESRSHSRRIFFHSPVVVTYDVSQSEKLVYVLRISDLS